MPNGNPVRYRDAHGVWHDVRVERTARGDWEIVDTAGGERRVIEMLLGYEEGRAEAEAIALDYAGQHHQPKVGRSGAANYGFAA